MCYIVGEQSQGKEEQGMSRVIGIDLGTTNSCVSVVEAGRPVIIPNENGGRTTPSVVSFTREGERLVGDAALRQAVVNSARTVRSVKRRMGTDWRFSVDGRSWSPQEISAMILQKLKKDAESFLGGPVTEAVIAVPAYFNDIQRQATKDAGRIAGLNVLRIINEPTSAALAYGLDNGAQQKVMVFDLGGGTFDVSVIEIGGGVIEVLATNGDNHLGGDDFDEVVTGELCALIRSQHRFDPRRDPAALQRVRDAAEQAKKELSTSERAYISLPYLTAVRGEPVNFEHTLTRTRFNELTRHLIERTAGPVRNALADAGISASQLGRVILVGGSTRIPAVQDMVRELTGREPSKSINPDECVAQGAAAQGANLSGGALTLSGGAAARPGGGSGLLLLDVTPLSLSVETVGGVATRLVERNSTLPVHYSKIFSTAAPYQSDVEINVLQGERPMARDNKSIGRFRLGGIRRAPAGVPQIEVTFDIDANGILKVTARDLDTRQEQSITISGSERMSESEIDAAIRDAQRYAAQDGTRRSLLEANGEAERALSEARRILEKGKRKLSREDKKALKADISALEKLMASEKPDRMGESDIMRIREAARRLNDTAGRCAPMAE